MSLFDRHKVTHVPYQAPTVIQDTVHHVVQVGIPDDGIPRVRMSDFDEVVAQSGANADKSAGRRVINAGLKAVLREALLELKKKDPTHPMLDKKYRQKLFDSFEMKEKLVVNSIRKEEGFPSPPYNYFPLDHILEDTTPHTPSNNPLQEQMRLLRLNSGK
jgi:hypothetical protein